MNRVEVFLKAKEKLEALAQSEHIDINKYYSPATPKTLKENRAENQVYIAESCSNMDLPFLFYLFCGLLADRQYMGNIIKFYSKSSDTQQMLSDILLGYDPKKTIENYTDAAALKQAIINRYPNKIKNESKWENYLTGVHQCARFLVDGKIGGTDLSFEYLLTEPKTADELKVYLHKLRILIVNLCEVGPAVCYNWLKECGVIWLAKPDLHIKRVVAAELMKYDNKEFDPEQMDADKIIEKYRRNHMDSMSFPSGYGIRKSCKLYSDEFVALYMWEWAQEIRNSSTDSQCSAFKLDRILYLYCTNGHFYLDDDDDNDISESGLLGMIGE
ncbi:MAG TPA: hypothetical protein RWO09_09840 [Ruminococcus sp.]